MPTKLKTIIQKIDLVPNKTNVRLIGEFRQDMHERDLSQNHEINNLKVVISFANYLGSNTNFHQVNTKQVILLFLDSKRKTLELDPEKRWITTWNYYLTRIKLFFR